MNKILYNDYSTYIKSIFGHGIRKLSINIGFTCPNRDGSKGYGGCTYCNNNSFSPDYCSPFKTVKEQINDGILFFSAKYKNQKYLAYFQSYTNTYGNIEKLKALYLETLEHPLICGLIIGTRPDCISNELLDFFESLTDQYYIGIEFGVESTKNTTLDLINRGHTFEDTMYAYEISGNRKIHLGAHLIIGLPGEDEGDILNHIEKLNRLPLNTVKFHQLQIVKNTVMAHQFKTNPGFFNLFSVEDYINLMTKIIPRLRPDIVIDRFVSSSPNELLVAPNWNGLKNSDVAQQIKTVLNEKDLWQGKLYKCPA